MAAESKKILYGEISLKNEDFEKGENKHLIELEYYKTQNTSNNLFNVENFGVEIKKKEYVGSRVEEEAKCIENVTRKEEVINELIDTLKRNKVTPISLEEVVKDLFNVYI